jgi:hypothetical protein
MMENELKLYMVLLGCTPKGRLTEQHDIYFGIATSLQAMAKDMYAFWPDGGDLHIDAWREVTHINGHSITVVPNAEAVPTEEKLFLLNLGGYRPGEFEEYHYKTLIVAKKMSDAIKASKKSTFYKHYGFNGAESHIDEKYALDVDDMHKVEDVLAPHLKALYSINISQSHTIGPEDELHIGYTKLKKV